MKNTKKRSGRRWLPLLLLSLSLASCASVPPDVVVFESLTQRLSTDPVTGHLILKPSPTCMEQIGEIECGHGVYMVSGRQVFVGEGSAHLFNGKPWSQLKKESIYVPAKESMAPLNTYIINSCKKANCSDQVTRFKVKLDSLNGVKAVIGGN